MTPESAADEEPAWDIRVRANPFGSGAEKVGAGQFLFEDHLATFGVAEGWLTTALLEVWESDDVVDLGGLLDAAPPIIGRCPVDIGALVDETNKAFDGLTWDRWDRQKKVERNTLFAVAELVALLILLAVNEAPNNKATGVGAVLGGTAVARRGGFPICLRSEFRILANMWMRVGAALDAADDISERKLTAFIAARILVATRCCSEP